MTVLAARSMTVVLASYHADVTTVPSMYGVSFLAHVLLPLSSMTMQPILLVALFVETRSPWQEKLCPEVQSRQSGLSD